MAKYIFQMRRGTAAQWEANNSIVPMAGEIVIEIDETNSFHKLKIGDGVHAYADLAYLMAGDEVVTQVLAKALPRVVTVELTTNWTKNADGKYSQTIALDNITGCSRLDLQPDADMLAEFKASNLIFTTENTNGTITVYSVGDMPLKSYTMQATIVETDAECEKIIGTPVGSSGIQVDATYSSTSGNPQSGIAVAEAVESNKQYIDSQVEAINSQIETIASGKLKREVVSELPSAESASENILYMVGPKEDETYEEYMFVENKFELIGSTSVDLSGYVTTEGLNAAVDAAIDEAKASGEFEGTSVSITNIEHGEGDGAENKVYFSDGKTLSVFNGNTGSKGETGSTGPAGEAGADGYTPVKGVDYWTEVDKAEIKAYIDENSNGTTSAVTSVAGKTGVVTLDKSDVGLSDVDNTSDMDKPVSTAMINYMNGHVSANNPHNVDKADIGLGNVDNTSDMDKPVSTAVINYMDEHMSASNPHLVTKHDVGLGNVDNTSDTEKPVSDPTKDYISTTVPTLVDSAVASLGAVKIERQTYTGDGVTGADNPTSITFSRTPVLVLIVPEDFSVTAYGGIIFGNKAHVWQTVRSTDNKVYTLDASFSGNTVSWYTTAASNDSLTNSQMNVSGITYNVIGFVL